MEYTDFIIIAAIQYIITLLIVKEGKETITARLDNIDIKLHDLEK